MKAHWSYLKVVIRHKWFVFRACLALGVPFWRAVVHDWTKFIPVEWGPYVRNFYNPDGSKREVRDSTGAYDPNSQSDEFKRAWMNHQRNKHHWQAWCSLGDGGSVSPLPIPETYIREMVADWCGAGMAYSNRADPRPWYEANKQDMVLHPETRRWLELFLGSVTMLRWLDQSGSL